jgi:hypothetical protein
MEISTNYAAIEAAVKSAFKDAVLLAGVEATKIISRPRSWAGYPDTRDIVDLGQLRASQQIVFTSDTSAEIRYPVAYSAPVHNGATIRFSNGNTRRIPARPWMDIALKNVPIEKTMGRLLKARNI